MHNCCGPLPSGEVDEIDLEISPESLAALDRLADLEEEEEDADEQNEPTTVPELMPNDESEDDDNDDYNDDEEHQTTPEQATRLKETKERVRQIIADADRLAEAISPDAMPVHVDGPTPQTDDEFTELVRRVLGDAFHFMDRVKVPVHHEWKAAYFAALRESIFIYDYRDKKLVENVLARKGKTWQEQVSFNFRYIAQRVRRRIPPRKMLHLRVKAVYDYFMNKTDSKTGKPLFNKIAKDIASPYSLHHLD